MVKIRVIIISNVQISAIYEILFEKFITVLPIIYQNKMKMPVKSKKCLVDL